MRVLRATLGLGEHWYTGRAVVTACSLALVYPLTLARSLNSLRHASVIAFVSLMYVAAALCVRFGGAPSFVDFLLTYRSTFSQADKNGHAFCMSKQSPYGLPRAVAPWSPV